MNSKRYSGARNANLLLGCIFAASAIMAGERAGKLQAKANIARALEEKREREKRTFVVDDEAIDIDDI